MIAQVTLVGRLGHDPELRYTPQATAVCDLSVAVQPYGQEDADWWEVTCWGKQAEFAANHLAKGGRVMVIGPATLRAWEGKDGQTRTRLHVEARTLQAIDWASDREDAAGAGEEPPPPAAPEKAARPVQGSGSRYGGRR